MKMPQAWGKVLASSIETETEGTKQDSQTAAALAASASKPLSVEASLDMGADTVAQGLCPECKKPMEIVTINGEEVYVCMSDRITLPIKDDPAGE